MTGNSLGSSAAADIPCGPVAADAMGEADSMGVPLAVAFHRTRRPRPGLAATAPRAGSRIGQVVDDLSGPPVAGCVLANEVLDNFPVHVLKVAEAGSVQEIYVDVDGESFV